MDAWQKQMGPYAGPMPGLQPFDKDSVKSFKALGVDLDETNNRIKSMLKTPGSAAAPASAPAAPALPLKDAKGGVLHADKNGAQAYVYPDGSFKEVK